MPHEMYRHVHGEGDGVLVVHSIYTDDAFRDAMGDFNDARSSAGPVKIVLRYGRLTAQNWAELWDVVAAHPSTKHMAFDATMLLCPPADVRVPGAPPGFCHTVESVYFGRMPAPCFLNSAVAYMKPNSTIELAGSDWPSATTFALAMSRLDGVANFTIWLGDGMTFDAKSMNAMQSIQTMYPCARVRPDGKGVTTL